MVVRRPACRGSRDVGGAAVVVDGDDVAEDVVAAVGVAGGVESVVAVGGAGRMDTCSDLNCGCPSQNAVLACKTGQGRWNMRWQIATEDVGSTGPEMCGLACRRAARWQFQGEFKVVSSGGRWYHAGKRQAGRRQRQKGWQGQWQAGRIAKSMSLSLLHANSRARRVRGCGGSSSGRVGRDETGKPYSGQAKQAGEQTSDGDSRSIFSSAFVVPGSR